MLLIINDCAARIHIPIAATRCISYNIACVMFEKRNVSDIQPKKPHANVRGQLLRIMQIGTAAPCRALYTYLAYINAAENKSETCLRPFLVNLIFLSGHEREKERERGKEKKRERVLIWPVYMVAATATRRNSKTTIIKANSKEVVCKKKTGRLRLMKDARFVLKTFIFLIYLYFYSFFFMRLCSLNFFDVSH